MIYDSIVSLIGKTPLVKIKGFIEDNGDTAIFGKLEFLNPAGSVKDRIALQMIADGKSSGKINDETTIIAPTSGNTGIGLALICAATGLKLVVTMPETMSVERQHILKAYGAQVVLTDGKRGMSGAVERAKEMTMISENSFFAGQFENASNLKAHYENTAKEIWEDMNGEINAVVCGVGSAGTIMGVSKFLKEKNRNIKVFAVQPFESKVLSGEAPGIHGIEGIGANFLPPLYEEDAVDEIISIDTSTAIETSKKIIRTNGLFVGISSGAAVYAATEISIRKDNTLKNIVVVLPDSADRYFSTSLMKD